MHKIAVTAHKTAVTRHKIAVSVNKTLVTLHKIAVPEHIIIATGDIVIVTRYLDIVRRNKTAVSGVAGRGPRIKTVVSGFKFCVAKDMSTVFVVLRCWRVMRGGGVS